MKNKISFVVVIIVLVMMAYYYQGDKKAGNVIMRAEENTSEGNEASGVSNGGTLNLITNGPMLSLTGKTWVWDRTLMNDGTTITPRRKDAFTVTFSRDGKAGGTTDCNSFFSTFKLSGGRITFSEMGSTLMFCEGSQEAEFLGMIQNADGFLFDNSGNLVLTLKFNSGSVFFKKK